MRRQVLHDGVGVLFEMGLAEIQVQDDALQGGDDLEDHHPLAGGFLAFRGVALLLQLADVNHVERHHVSGVHRIAKRPG